MKLKYNLRGEEEATGKNREMAEHGAFQFLRYFFPSIVPLLIYLGVTIGLVVISSTLIYPFLSHEEYLRQKLNIYNSLGVFVTFFILKRYSKKRSSTFFGDASLNLKDLSLQKALLSVVFGVGAAIAISSLISLLPKIGPIATYQNSIEGLYRSWSVLLGVLVNTFFTPIVEEVIFRGYMLNRLLPHWGEKWALLTVSLVFAFMHGTSIWILYAFIMGFIIGKLAIKENNIFYAIVMHVGFNLPASVLWHIYVFFPGSEEALRQNKWMIALLGLLGLVSLIFAYKVYNRRNDSREVSGETLS
ncbi:MAG: CPBP family intramembrane metalloprotease [Lachnospiraceae bacterium]|nr:CPBP family intramembrane metalloprotease [Lachnospiraceae bacterium]